MDFETNAALVGLGLWVGTGVVGNTLPLDSAPDREGNALHINGAGEAKGVDLYWHTAFPIETAYESVSFWAKTDIQGGSELVVTVGGAGASYWPDVTSGMPWPAQTFRLSQEWQKLELSFATLGISPEMPAPHSQPYGAIHFAVAPNTPYDVWLDDLEVFGLSK